MALGATTQFKRESFREFMKEVDFVGGRINLASLQGDELKNLLRPIYEKAYNNR